jgi:DNA repair exonuclease SbcCD ATPase subunit
VCMATQIEKLKDLCLKQREELKVLKDAVLFPEETNLQMQDLVEKQGEELKQAKQVIPTLQMEISSLTAHLHCLALDLAQVPVLIPNLFSSPF